MFENLTQRLGDVFDRLTRRGALSEADVDTALREVRVALLEADVALPVVKDFIDHVKTQAVGEAVLKSVTPPDGHQDRARPPRANAGAESSALDMEAQPPVPILMVGLRGSGKTTRPPRSACA
jgi:signal recognition particle subunit SRP54